jgi:type I restriction enzyme S subunit
LRQQDFKKIGSDSAVPGLNRNQAHENVIVVPQKEVIDEFNNTVKPFFDKKYLLQKEIDTLTKFRDSLLPKLMSGKIEIHA